MSDEKKTTTITDAAAQAEQLEREARPRTISMEYLTAMAVRACTYRNADGFRTVTTDALYALPLLEFQMICAAARRFLMRWGQGGRRRMLAPEATSDPGEEQ